MQNIFMYNIITFIKIILLDLGGLWNMPVNRESKDFWNKIDFFRANSYQMRQDSIHVSFEDVCTQSKENLFRLVFVGRVKVRPVNKNYNKMNKSLDQDFMIKELSANTNLKRYSFDWVQRSSKETCIESCLI